ncbi:MAG: hypothetical protein HOV81_33090 [Kofleriaceae bacterium]|nr:hypothetical protein [Kofleriaceae bacterium]
MLAGLAGCGDNSKTCGPGTEDVDGVCTGSGGGGQCTDGTILVDDHCEIDPNSCQDGTVLMGDKCVDPATHMATIEEAAEPNGLGLGGETSNDPAGEIALKPVGEHFTIHGKIIPFQDADGDGQQDADFDSYLLDVNGPTLINVSADGLHGLAGGFVAVAAVSSTDPLSNWTRFGVNPIGDTAKRQIYLPQAGTYVLAIADTRSLFLSGAAPGAQADAPAFEYYVTVDQLTAPTPTALTATAGVATSQGQMNPGEVKLFSLAMGDGVNSAELAVGIDQVVESIVVANNRGSTMTIKAVADEDSSVGTASATVFGVRSATDTQIVVVDALYDTVNAPYDYDLTINIGTAGALSTTGGDVGQPSSTTDFSVFYYDVPADGLTVGMDLAWDRPVSGFVLDEDGFIFSSFTYLDLLGDFDGSFEGYTGLLRHAAPGRYFFMVYDPTGDATDITATSTYAGLQPANIVRGTPLTNQAVNAYNSVPFKYTSDVATTPWQLFNMTGSGTGALTATYYDPDLAIGRLDALDVPDCQFCFDDAPLAIFQHGYAEAGTPRGRILLDDATPEYFVKVNAANTTGTRTINVDFAARAFTDLGNIAIGTPATRMNVALDTTNTVQRYLARSTANNRLTALVHPHQVTLDTNVQPLNRDESARGPLGNQGTLGADDSSTDIVGANGWVAFEVTAPATAILGGQFDLTATALAGVTYTQSAGTTAFADACPGGATVALSNTDEGRSTGTIPVPAGFDFYGVPVSGIRVFSNGFLSVDTTLDCADGANDCYFTNSDIPNAAAPNGIVAPFWDDLVITGTGNAICRKNTGSKLIIQWTGRRYSGSTAVQFQAILDATNDTIEFVYGPGQAAANTGSTATIGIENQVGSAASKVGFNAAGTTVPKLFTPM